MTEEARNIKEKLDRVVVSKESISKITEDRIAYIYDSLCLRYNTARDAQAEWEIYRKRIDPETSWRLAQRDKMRFYEILNDLIGEHK